MTIDEHGNTSLQFLSNKNSLNTTTLTANSQHKYITYSHWRESFSLLVLDFRSVRGRESQIGKFTLGFVGYL
jgi:hypothetical protein